jgi:hypothetical protein
MHERGDSEKHINAHGEHRGGHVQVNDAETVFLLVIRRGKGETPNDADGEQQPSERRQPRQDAPTQALKTGGTAPVLQAFVQSIFHDEGNRDRWAGIIKEGVRELPSYRVRICLVKHDVFRAYLMIMGVGLWGLVMHLTAFLKFYAIITGLYRIKF